MQKWNWRYFLVPNSLLRCWQQWQANFVKAIYWGRYISILTKCKKEKCQLFLAKVVKFGHFCTLWPKPGNYGCWGSFLTCGSGIFGSSCLPNSWFGNIFLWLTSVKIGFWLARVKVALQIFWSGTGGRYFYFRSGQMYSI